MLTLLLPTLRILLTLRNLLTLLTLLTVLTLLEVMTLQTLVYEASQLEQEQDQLGDSQQLQWTHEQIAQRRKDYVPFAELEFGVYI